MATENSVQTPAQTNRIRLQRMNPLHPNKLLLTKWTAVKPVAKEKHFLVVKLILPEMQEYERALTTVATSKSRLTRVMRAPRCARPCA